MAHAVEAAIALVCKNRNDSFVNDSFQTEGDSGVWEDMLQGEAALIEEKLRTKPAPVLPAKAKRQQKSRYNDENRPSDANIDRREAMRLATKPIGPKSLRAAPVATNAPDLGALRLERTSSMKQSFSVSLSMTPRSAPRGGASSVGTPGYSHRAAMTENAGGSATPRQSTGQSTPRQGQRSLLGERNGQMTPRGHSGERTGQMTPRQNSNSFQGECREQTTPRNSRSFGGTSDVGQLTPRQNSFSILGERVGAAPLQAMGRSPSHHAQQRSPRDHTPHVVYQPRGGSSSVSYAPPDLQPRSMTRCTSDNLERIVSFSGSQAGRATPQMPSRPNFFHGAAGPEDAGRQQLPKRVSTTQAASYDLGRQPSFDATVCQEQTRHASKMHGRVREEGIVTPRTGHAPELFAGRFEASRRGRPLNPLLDVQPVTTARSRSNSVFWEPPPDAAVLCEKQKSPSFLMASQLEVQEGGLGLGTAEDRELTEDMQAAVGSSSPTAVVQAMCTTMGTFLPISPPTAHRDARPASGSFSYQPSRQQNQRSYQPALEGHRPVGSPPTPRVRPPARPLQAAVRGSPRGSPRQPAGGAAVRGSRQLTPRL